MCYNFAFENEIARLTQCVYSIKIHFAVVFLRVYQNTCLARLLSMIDDLLYYNFYEYL